MKLIGISLPLLASSSLQSEDYYKGAFAQWKGDHSKTYSSNELEAHAFEAFVENDIKIEAHNEKNLSWAMGHNQFSDLTAKEFKDQYLNYVPSEFASNTTSGTIEKLDSDLGTIDWVKKGAVTGVKNQGQCGSCWTFSTIGAIEGGLKVDTGVLKSLSEKSIFCSKLGGAGCQGGSMDQALKWVKNGHGVPTEANDPYSPVNGCKKGTAYATISGVKHYTGENNVLRGLNNRPLSVAVSAESWQSYKSGVISSCSGSLDHGVTLVASGSNFVKIKNSWGTTWGERGYIRLAKGKNMCSYANDVNAATGVKHK